MPAKRPQAKSQMERSWLARLAAAVLVPAVLFGTLELVLRVGGYGYSTRFFSPAGDGKSLTTNPKFAWQFYHRSRATAPVPVLFPREKAAGTRRVFILGESAAAGTPDPAFGFARMLELMLADRFPTSRFEVVNAAMRGIDSHIVRQIAAECAELSPDVFVVYLGNNELIGRHAPSADEFTISLDPHWLRFTQAIRRTKIAQFGQALLERVGPDRSPKTQDMEYFRRQRLAFDDPRREPVYRNHAANLADIVRFAESAGARALVCSVGVNLRDFPPLGSLHRRDFVGDSLKEWDRLFAAGVAAEARREFTLALTNYANAARLDEQHAELLFRRARCHEALGQPAEAQRDFALARDRDALQFRTDSRLNHAARSIGTNSPAARLLDVEHGLATSALAENGVPGSLVFNDHVHFTFAGDHHVASLLLTEIAAALQLPPAARPPLSRDECARRLAYTPVDEMNVKEAMTRLTANPPFLGQEGHAERQAAAEAAVRRMRGSFTLPDFERALATGAEAVQARPDDWMLRFNHANLLLQLNQGGPAVAEFAEVVKRLPGHAAFRLAYGGALLQTGRRAEAAAEFEAALKLDPDSASAREGVVAAQKGR